MKRALLALALVATLVLGCSNGKKPKDLPKLYPASVSIKMDGAALEGALVMFQPTDGSNWMASGTTDATGAANLMTQGQWNGVAAGKFKVTVEKMDHDPNYQPKVTKLEDGTEFKEEGEILKNFVDMNYSSSATTPLEADVSTEKNQRFEFEVQPSK